MIHLLIFIFFSLTVRAETENSLGQTGQLPVTGLDFTFKGRDPFKRPEISPDQMPKKKTDLENYQLEQLKFVAVTSGPERVTGLISASDGKTFFVREKMRIGPNEGVVKKIGAEGLIIYEKFTNILGEIETVETIIPLQPEKVKPGESNQPLLSNILADASQAPVPGPASAPNSPEAKPDMTSPTFGGGGDLLKNISQSMSGVPPKPAVEVAPAQAPAKAAESPPAEAKAALPWLKPSNPTGTSTGTSH